MVQIVKHTSNKDDYADVVDPQHVAIKNHVFGPNFDNFAIQLTRNDTAAVPSSVIEIIDSVFEHSSSDEEMFRFFNIQPTDRIIIRGCTMVHEEDNEDNVQMSDWLK